MNIEGLKRIARLPGKGDPYRIMSVARNMALKSPHHDFNVGAVLTKNGQVLSIGHNHNQKTHPEAQTRNRTVHAELDAIIGLDRNLLKNAVVWVYRERKDGSLGMAKPCLDCQRILLIAHVRHAIYTHPVNGIEMMRIF